MDNFRLCPIPLLRVDVSWFLFSVGVTNSTKLQPNAPMHERTKAVVAKSNARKMAIDLLQKLTKLEDVSGNQKETKVPYIFVILPMPSHLRVEGEA